MDEFSLSLHGVSARVRAEAPEFTELVRRLAFDFSAASDKAPPRPAVTVHLAERIPSDECHRLWPVFKNAKVTVRGGARHRICDFTSGVRAEMRRTAEGAEIWVAGGSAEGVHETAYKVLHSVLGEELDIRGLHRVHALAFEHGESRHLITAPSGCGKTALAVQLARLNNFALYSDECPLLKGTALFDFPVRLALAPEVARAVDAEPSGFQSPHSMKELLPFPSARAASGPVDFLWVGVPGDAPAIRPLTRFRAIPALAAALIVGQGLVQMAEWMLRGRAIPRLSRIAWSRAVTAARVLMKVKTVYEFRMGPDARANAQFLLRFLNSETGPSSKAL